MNFSKIVFKYNTLLLGSLIVASVGLVVFFLKGEVSRIYQQDFFTYPANQYKLFLFLSRSSLVLLPFLLGVSIIGIWLFLKARMKYVILPSSEKISVNRTLLSDNEKIILDAILSNDGEMMQVDLRDTHLKPYTISRVLARLEGVGLIQRRRYGMTKMIYLNYSTD